MTNFLATTAFFTIQRHHPNVAALLYGDDVPFSDPLPTALSPSRLQDFQSCPRRFQHGAVERIAQLATYATAKGNLAHHVLERLFELPGEQRTRDAAESFIDEAESKVLNDKVRDDIGLDETMLQRLRREIVAILDSYFTMEDPTDVHCEGVELRLTDEIDGVPMLGILDRLDRGEAGELTIVDYKTGSLPNRAYDSQTFANTELYAALCEKKLGQRPTSIRLLYVTQGEVIERSVTEPVVIARRRMAANAWRRITEYYNNGDFPATPSKNTCRFCSYKDRCRANGVAVPS